MTRLALYTTTFDASVARLRAKGLEPMAEPTPADLSDRIAAYKDPDGFVVYLIVFKAFPMSQIFKAARWFNKVKDPQLFHWTLNVTDVGPALKAFDGFGFKSLYDATPQMVRHELLPAFGISATTTKIKHIRMAKLPADQFVATIMEWVEPRTTHKGAEKLNAMALAVEDVDAALRAAAEAGLPTEEAATKSYPVLGKARVGAAFVDSTRIELLRFERAA